MGRGQNKYVVKFCKKNNNTVETDKTAKMLLLLSFEYH